MYEYKKLLWTVGGICGLSVILIGVVAAYDRSDDLASIGHVFDFHLDTAAVREHIEQENAKRQEDERIQREWCRDLSNDRSGSNDGPGTCTGPDRDR